MINNSQVLYFTSLIHSAVEETGKVLDINDYGWIENIKEIFLYEKINEYNISLLREFIKDLNSYYEKVKKQ